MELNILLGIDIIHVWAVPRDSPLPHGGLTKVKILLYMYVIALLYKFT